MVQYNATPWRDRSELLQMRRQFYPDKTRPCTEPCTDSAWPGWKQTEELHQAVARAAMWVQRGNCPHMVESTALLAAAILGDDSRGCECPHAVGESRGDVAMNRRLASVRASSAHCASRAAYAAAFSRFVTGLLDSQQTRQHKISMYALAKTIGLPATFVELRHQSTHEQLPSLARLRGAAARALEWAWTHFWARLEDGGAARQGSRCREGVLGALRSGTGSESVEGLARLWGRDRVLATLQDIVDGYDANESAAGSRVEPSVVVAALRLEKDMLCRQRAAGAAGRDLEGVKQDIAQARRELEAGWDEEDEDEDEDDDDGSGWKLCGANWRPKPMGVP